MSNPLWEFIQKYYINSIVYKTGYNPVNTATWAVILIAAVYLIYKYLSKFVEFDERFVLSNVPFILFGSSIRVFEDAGFIKPPISYAFMSPMIYVLVFSIAFPIFLACVRIRGKDYWKAYGLIGIFLLLSAQIVLFSRLRVENWFVFPSALAIAISLTAAYRFVTSRHFRHMRNGLSELVFFSHSLDAAATSIGISFLGYWELHVIPRLLIRAFGPWVLIPVKVFVFFAILYVLDKERDENAKNFVKFVLIVLGLGPAIRDSIRMTFGV